MKLNERYINVYYFFPDWTFFLFSAFNIGIIIATLYYLICLSLVIASSSVFCFYSILEKNNYISYYCDNNFQKTKENILQICCAILVFSLITAFYSNHISKSIMLILSILAMFYIVFGTAIAINICPKTKKIWIIKTVYYL